MEEAIEVEDDNNASENSEVVLLPMPWRFSHIYLQENIPRNIEEGYRTRSKL